MDVTIFHDRLGDVCLRVLFHSVRNLAVSILLCTSFNYIFIRGIFPAKRTAVP